MQKIAKYRPHFILGGFIVALSICSGKTNATILVNKEMPATLVTVSDTVPKKHKTPMRKGNGRRDTTWKKGENRHRDTSWRRRGDTMRRYQPGMRRGGRMDSTFRQPVRTSSDMPARPNAPAAPGTPGYPNNPTTPGIPANPPAPGSPSTTPAPKPMKPMTP